MTFQEALYFINQLQSSRPINPISTCEDLGIRVISDKLLEKDGYLVCAEGQKLIFISSRITNAHRKRFIVAHEIGHFLLHSGQLYGCSDIVESKTLRVNSRDQESEANMFASELLLPKELLQKCIPNRRLSFDDICRIALSFDTSVTFSALKAVQFSKTEEEILLCYEGQSLKWYSLANNAVRRSQVPYQCPILNVTQKKVPEDISGIWDDMFSGTVHQEFFHPFGTQTLILLSGIRK